MRISDWSSDVCSSDLPPIRGLVQMDGQLHPKVHAFRSLVDCDRLLATLPTARRAVVVGGGLLGIQVARALSVRGVDTEIVEGTDHLLSTQLDERGGSILKRGLKKLGTDRKSTRLNSSH